MNVTPDIDFISIIFLLGSAQGFFLSLAILSSKHGNLAANRILALFTFVFSVTLIDSFMDFTGYFVKMPHLIGTILPTNFLYGPLLYLYVNRLILDNRKQYNSRQLVHFLPFMLAIIVLLPFYTLPAEIKLEMMYGRFDSIFLREIEAGNLHIIFVALGILLQSIASIVQIGCYLLVILFKLHRHSRKIKNYFSYTEKINLAWVRNLTYAAMFLWLMFLFAEWFSESFGVTDEAEYLLNIAIAILIYAMGYIGIRQRIIFIPGEGIPEETEQTDANTNLTEQEKGRSAKYSKSGLDNGRSLELEQQLLSLMDSDKPYLDNQLSMPALAIILDTSPHNLSQVINHNLNMNFFDFINRYRIEEAKKMILDTPTEQRMNVYAIALDAGFTSKSAFYTAFKKYTGTSPGDFRKSTHATQQQPNLV